MKRYFFGLALLIAACNQENKPLKKLGFNHPSTSNGISLQPFAAADFDWKTIEKDDNGLKEKFIANLPTSFTDEFAAYNTEFYNQDSLIRHLHAVDLNGDGQDDLIFEGASGGEGDKAALILNKGNSFEVPFKTYQHFKAIEFTGKQLSRLYIQDPGCCSEYIVYNKVYDIDLKSANPLFKLTYLSANHTQTKLPKKYFDSPIKFQVLNDRYKMRVEPTVNDTSEMLSLDGTVRKGNSIAELSLGAVGTALAEAKDSTGRIWWFVEIAPDYKLTNSVFYDDPDAKIQARKVGWISSRYVKRI